MCWQYLEKGIYFKKYHRGAQRYSENFCDIINKQKNPDQRPGFSNYIKSYLSRNNKPSGKLTPFFL